MASPASGSPTKADAPAKPTAAAEVAESAQVASAVTDPSRWGHSRDFNLQMLMELKAAFDAVDTDGSAALDQAEFCDAMRNAMSVQNPGGPIPNDQMLMLLFLKIDANSNGTVDWDEFTNHVLLNSAHDMTEDGAVEEGLQYVRVARYQNPHEQVASPHTTFVSQLRREQDKFALLRLTTGINHVAQVSDRHTDMITKFVYAPHLRVYVSGGRDGTVRTWNAVTLQPLRCIQNSNKVLGARWVTDVMLPEDSGPMLPLSVCSYDKSISLYDATRNSMDMVGRITDLEGVPTCSHYVRGSTSLDQEMMAWGDEAGNINFFKLADGWGNHEKKPGAAEIHPKKIAGMTPLPPYATHSSWVTKIAFLSLSDALLTASMDSTLCLTDLTREKPKWLVKEHINGVNSFAYCQTFNFIASCGMERHVLLHNNLTGKLIGTLEGHLASISEVVLNEAANQLISLSVDKVIKVWDVRYNQCLQTIEDKMIYWPENRISAMYYNTSRQELVTATTRLDIWRPQLHGESTPMPPPEVAAPGGDRSRFRRPLDYALVSQAFNLLVTLDDSSGTKVWSVETGNAVVGFNAVPATGAISEETRVTAICFDDEQRRLFTGSANGAMRIWNFNSGNVLVELGAIQRETEITHVRYMEEGMSTYVLAAGDRKVWVWELSSGGHSYKPMGPYHALEGHSEDIQCLTVCRKESRGQKSLIASGGFDGRILLHEISGSIRMQLMCEDNEDRHPEERAIEQLCYLTKRGNVLVAGAGDGRLYFWRVILGDLAHEVVSNHGRYVMTAICTDADNQLLYTADSRGRVHGWSLKGLEFRGSGDFNGRGWDSIKQLYGWRAHEQQIQSVDLLPGSSPGAPCYVVTASIDGLSKLWTESGTPVGTFSLHTWTLADPSTWVPATGVPGGPDLDDPTERGSTSLQNTASRSPKAGSGPAQNPLDALLRRSEAAAWSASNSDDSSGDDLPAALRIGGIRRRPSRRLSAEAQVFLHDVRQTSNVATWRQAQAGNADDALLKHRLHIHDLAPVEVPERLTQRTSGPARGQAERRGGGSRVPAAGRPAGPSSSLPSMRPVTIDFSAHRSS